MMDRFTGHPWDNTNGCTVFVCQISEELQPIFTMVSVKNQASAVMFEWSTGTVKMFETAGVIDTDLHITGIPGFGDSGHGHRPRVMVFRWDPGVSAEFYIDGGTKVGTGPVTVATQFPLVDMFFPSTIWNFVAGDSSLKKDAGLGFKTYRNSFLAYKRALTDAQVNQVGQFLADRFGANWTNI